MSNAVQYGSTQVLDLTMTNNSVTAIPAGTAVLFGTAAADIVGGNTPPGCVIPTASGGVVGTAGVTVETIPASGGVGKVRFMGTYPVLADGSITVGNYVQASDTSLKVGRVKAKGAGLEQLGQATNSATDGQYVLVLITKAACA